MKKFVALFGAFAVAFLLVGIGSPHRAVSAPTVSTYECTPKIVYNDTLGTRAGDSTFTDSVSVFGARAIYLVVVSAMNSPAGTQSDSINVPVIQCRMPGGQFTYIGGTSFLPLISTTTALTATTAITNAARMALGYNAEVTSAGTPVPVVTDYVRWRLIANEVRANYVANIRASTGRITVTAYIWR